MEQFSLGAIIAAVDGREIILEYFMEETCRILTYLNGRALSFDELSPKRRDCMEAIIAQLGDVIDFEKVRSDLDGLSAKYSPSGFRGKCDCVESADAEEREKAVSLWLAEMEELYGVYHALVPICD